MNRIELHEFHGCKSCEPRLVEFIARLARKHNHELDLISRRLFKQMIEHAADRSVVIGDDNDRDPRGNTHASALMDCLQANDFETARARGKLEYRGLPDTLSNERKTDRR